MAADDNAANALLQVVLEDDFEEFMEAQRRTKRRRVTEVLGALKEVICEDPARPSDSDRIRGIEGFISDVVPRYTDTQFKEHFRMHRSTFEVLLQLTEPNLAKTIGVRVPTATKVLMTLWLLGNQESYRGVADRFGVHKSTLHFVVYEIVLVWARCAPSVIQWPTQLAQVASQFERKWRLPGVVGAVDGCHVSIKAPKEEQSAFYNRKEFHSVVLQGCCDSRMVFTHVHVGSPGRMNDARILTNSGLDDILSALPEDLHILGDSAYPLGVNLMRPYKDNGHLTRRQSKFNTTLGASRSVIERAFAQLKGKFRRLKHLDMDNLNMVPMFVMAACVLHNVILTSAKPFVLCTEELEDPCLVRKQPDMTRAPSAAKAKRDAIASLLHPACT
ncbi:protein ALP1-like [Ixodes scapularis]|uniref:protein ALP1-like n=1 Tax=Ixodes scapularis TaxID=6945 RepID=UPI001A9EB96A|nr:protein ALP1-like [Ixodes scapularis]